MKLKQIVCDGTTLNLIKEKKVIEYGEVFEVSEERGKEILKVTYKNKPVAEIFKEKENSTEKTAEKKNTAEKTAEQPKQEPKKENKKQESK